MARNDVTVRVEGLREFRRALKRVSPAVDKELRDEIKEAAEDIAVRARMSPVTPRATGAYARSIRPYVTGAKVSIGSRLPQAGVLHWGGTIRPRGVPIVFPERPTVYDAARQQMTRTVDRFGDAVERAAVKAGW